MRHSDSPIGIRRTIEGTSGRYMPPLIVITLRIQQSLGEIDLGHQSYAVECVAEMECKDRDTRVEVSTEAHCSWHV